MKNVLTLIASAAMLFALAACDEPATNAKAGDQSPSATATTEAKVESKKEIWPPKPEGEIVLASNPLQTNIMVVYDGSGSMKYDACGASGNRHSAAVPAVKKFVAAVPNDASLGLYIFDSRKNGIRVPLGVNNKKEFNSALDEVRIGDGTPLKSSMTEAYYALLHQAQAQLGYGRYIMLVVTDGEANSGESPAGVVQYLVDSTPIEVHTVGLCFEGRHSLNQPGKTFYTNAQNPEQLIEGLKAALAEANEADVKFDATQ